MSRPTEFLLPIATKLSPTPQPYDLKITNQGQPLINKVSSPSIQDQLRGTLSKDNRFRDYKYNAFVRSNPMIGPGSHSDMENFKQLKKKPCKVIMSNQIYKSREIRRSVSNESRKSRSRSNKSAKIAQRNSAFDDKLNIGRVSTSNSRSRSPNRVINSRKLDGSGIKNLGPVFKSKDDPEYVVTGNLLMKSPMKGETDNIQNKINFQIYKQDSFDHRQHLLNVIKKKSLRKERKRIAVSYRHQGQQGFKVGYSGEMKDLYKSNEDKHLKKIHEQRNRSREKKRKSMYKEIFGPGYGSKSNIKKQIEIPASKMRKVDREIEAQIQSVEKLKQQNQIQEQSRESLINITLDPLKAKEDDMQAQSPIKQTFQSSTMIGSKGDLKNSGHDQIQEGSSGQQANSKGIQMQGSISSSINSNLYNPVLNSIAHRMNRDPSSKRDLYTQQENKQYQFMPQTVGKPPMGKVRPKSAKNKGAIRSSSILNSKQRPASGKINMRQKNKTVSIYKDSETNHSNAQFIILEEEDLANDHDSQQREEHYNIIDDKNLENQNDQQLQGGIAVNNSFQVLEEARQTSMGKNRRQKRLQSAKVRPENLQNQALVYQQFSQYDTQHQRQAENGGSRRRQRPASGQPDIATRRYAKAAQQQAAFQKSRIMANVSMGNPSSIHQSATYQVNEKDISSQGNTEYILHPDQQIQPDNFSNNMMQSENTRVTKSSKMIDRVIPSYNSRERMQEYQSDKAFQYYRQTFVKPGPQRFSIGEQIDNVTKNAEIQYQKQIKAIRNQKPTQSPNIQKKIFNKSGPVKVMPEQFSLKSLKTFENFKKTKNNYKTDMNVGQEPFNLPKQKIRPQSGAKRAKNYHSSSLQLSMAQIYDPFLNPVVVVKHVVKKRRRLVPKPPVHQSQQLMNQHQLDKLEEEDQAKEADTLLNDQRENTHQDEDNQSIKLNQNNIIENHIQLQDDHDPNLETSQILESDKQIVVGQESQASLVQQPEFVEQMKVDKPLVEELREYEEISLPSHQAQNQQNSQAPLSQDNIDQSYLESLQVEHRLEIQDKISKQESQTIQQQAESINQIQGVTNEQERINSLQQPEESSESKQMFGLRDPEDLNQKSYTQQQSQEAYSGFQTFEGNQNIEKISEISKKSSKRYKIQQTIEQSNHSRYTQEQQQFEQEPIIKDQDLNQYQQSIEQEQNQIVNKNKLTQQEVISTEQQQERANLHDQATMEQAQYYNADVNQVVDNVQKTEVTDQKTNAEEQQAQLSISNIEQVQNQEYLDSNTSRKSLQQKSSQVLVGTESKQTYENVSPHLLQKDDMSKEEMIVQNTSENASNSNEKIQLKKINKQTSRTNKNDQENVYQNIVQNQEKADTTEKSIEFQKSIPDSHRFDAESLNVKNLQSDQIVSNSQRDKNTQQIVQNEMGEQQSQPTTRAHGAADLDDFQKKQVSEEHETKNQSKEKSPVQKDKNQQESSDTLKKSQLTNQIGYDDYAIEVSKSNSNQQPSNNGRSSKQGFDKKRLSSKAFLEDNNEYSSIEQAQKSIEKQQPPVQKKVFQSSMNQNEDELDQQITIEQYIEHQQSINQYSYYSESQQSQSITHPNQQTTNQNSQQQSGVSIKQAQSNNFEDEHSNKLGQNSTMTQKQQISNSTVTHQNQNQNSIQQNEDSQRNPTESQAPEDIDLITQEEQEDDQIDHFEGDQEQNGWYYNAGNHQTVHKVAYEDEESNIIEKYYQERVNTFEVKFGGQNLVFDLQKMLQHQKNDMNKSKAIYRIKY